MLGENGVLHACDAHNMLFLDPLGYAVARSTCTWSYQNECAATLQKDIFGKSVPHHHLDSAGLQFRVDHWLLLWQYM